MNRFFYYGALLLNVIQTGFAFFTFATGYGSDRLLALLLVLPPLLSIIALRCGPDLEERRLGRELNKARMRKELQDLSK